MIENSGIKVQLRGLNGDYNGIDYNVEKDEFLIGRHFDCDLIIKEKTVSAEHAKIIKTEDYYEIMDLSSSNGTFVNREKVTKKRLRTEDIISIDKFDFRFINPGEVERTIISDGEDLRRSLDNTEIREQLPQKNINREKPDTNPFNIKEAQYEIRSGSKAIERRKKGHGLTFGLFLSLIMAFVINIGFVFLIRMIRLATFSFNSILNSFKMLLAGFPFLHLHTYWTSPNSADVFHILTGVCIPLGLILAGVIIQRSSGGNRFRNALTFSFSYVVIVFFLQFCALKFSANTWITLNISIKPGFISADQNVFLVISILYFWFITFLFSLIGTQFQKK